MVLRVPRGTRIEPGSPAEDVLQPLGLGTAASPAPGFTFKKLKWIANISLSQRR